MAAPRKDWAVIVRLVKQISKSTFKDEALARAAYHEALENHKGSMKVVELIHRDGNGEWGLVYSLRA